MTRTSSGGEHLSLHKFVAIIQNAQAKQNLSGPALKTKIAASAKNRYQIIIRGHGLTFS